MGLILMGAIAGCSAPAAPPTPVATPVPVAPTPTPAATPTPAVILPSAGDIARGKVIFEKTAGGVGCASCHGLDAWGLVGPGICGVTGEEIVTALLGKVPTMAFIKLTPQEIVDVAAYLKDLESQP